MNSRFSVCIITFNEEKNIKRCLESVKWADEIIILDSGSTDKTLDIAKKYTEKIYQKPWSGYSLQKQSALNLATGEWLLSLDADEELSFELQHEIQKTLINPSFFAYQFPRKLVFQNKILHYAEGRSIKFRLFKKGSAQMSKNLVHEELQTTNAIGNLKGILYHHSFYKLTSLIEKMNAYSSLAAKEKREKGTKGGVLKALAHGIGAFLKIYILQKAFLDGSLGFIYSVYLSEMSYYKYLKIDLDKL